MKSFALAFTVLAVLFSLSVQTSFLSQTAEVQKYDADFQKPISELDKEPYLNSDDSSSAYWKLEKVYGTSHPWVQPEGQRIPEATDINGEVVNTKNGKEMNLTEEIIHNPRWFNQPSTTTSDIHISWELSVSDSSNDLESGAESALSYLNDPLFGKSANWTLEKIDSAIERKSSSSENSGSIAQIIIKADVRDNSRNLSGVLTVDEVQESDFTEIQTASITFEVPVNSENQYSFDVKTIEKQGMKQLNGAQGQWEVEKINSIHEKLHYNSFGSEVDLNVQVKDKKDSSTETISIIYDNFPTENIIQISENGSTIVSTTVYSDASSSSSYSD